MIRLIANAVADRRHELVDATFGAAMVALTIVLTAAVLWLAVAVVVGSVTMGRWIGGFT